MKARNVQREQKQRPEAEIKAIQANQYTHKCRVSCSCFQFNFIVQSTLFYIATDSTVYLLTFTVTLWFQ